MVGAYWGVGSWWVPVFVVCRGAWSSCGAGALGCLVIWVGRVLLCFFGLVMCWVVVRPGVCCWDLGVCSRRRVVYFMFLVVLW